MHGAYTVRVSRVAAGSPHTSGVALRGNADFAAAAGHVSQVLTTLRSSQQHLLQLWASRRAQLDQGLQLTLYEADSDKVRGGGVDGVQRRHPLGEWGESVRPARPGPTADPLRGRL